MKDQFQAAPSKKYRAVVYLHGAFKNTGQTFSELDGDKIDGLIEQLAGGQGVIIFRDSGAVTIIPVVSIRFMDIEEM